MTDEEKIDAFERHILERQLMIARHLAQHFVEDDPSDPLSQSAFAILSIVSNYFEMIEQFSVGESSHQKSKQFFCSGMTRVFSTSEVSTHDANRLYSFMRCGMYHSAMPTDRCGLSRELEVPIRNEDDIIIINPALLVERLITHFSDYCDRIRGPLDLMLRENMLLLFSSFAAASPIIRGTSQTRTNTTPAPWEQ